MNIANRVQKHLEDGFTRPVAENIAAEEVILLKISGSKLADFVTLKGGIVMYNLTKNARRATRDIDFDFIRHSIDHDSVKRFVEKLNVASPQAAVWINGPVQDLHQQDYKGVRIKISIDDGSCRPLSLKLDIGVQADLSIEQTMLAFSFGEGERLSLMVNSPEQMFAEKCMSLSRFGPLSTRYKDIYDMCFLIRLGLDKDLTSSILAASIARTSRGPRNIQDIRKMASATLSNRVFSEQAANPKNSWLNVEYSEAADAIQRFLESLT